MNTDRPTPETDAAQHEGLHKGNPMPTRVVHINFARKLERERDELTALLAAEKATRNSIIEKGVQTERERDEAREALMKIEDLFVDGVDVYADREKMGLIARAALEGVK